MPGLLPHANFPDTVSVLWMKCKCFPSCWKSNNEQCYHFFYYYGPGDAIARVSRSSNVALHTLLSCVLHVASCSVRCSSLQSFLIMSIHRFFCLPLFLVPCTHPL